MGGLPPARPPGLRADPGPDADGRAVPECGPDRRGDPLADRPGLAGSTRRVVVAGAGIKRTGPGPVRGAIRGRAFGPGRRPGGPDLAGLAPGRAAAVGGGVGSRGRGRAAPLGRDPGRAGRRGERRDRGARRGGPAVGRLQRPDPRAGRRQPPMFGRVAAREGGRAGLAAGVAGGRCHRRDRARPARDDGLGPGARGALRPGDQDVVGAAGRPGRVEARAVGPSPPEPGDDDLGHPSADPGDRGLAPARLAAALLERGRRGRGRRDRPGPGLGASPDRGGPIADGRAEPVDVARARVGVAGPPAPRPAPGLDQGERRGRALDAGPGRPGRVGVVGGWAPGGVSRAAPPAHGDGGRRAPLRAGGGDGRRSRPGRARRLRLGGPDPRRGPAGHLLLAGLARLRVAGPGPGQPEHLGPGPDRLDRADRAVRPPAGDRPAQPRALDGPAPGRGLVAGPLRRGRWALRPFDAGSEPGELPGPLRGLDGRPARRPGRPEALPGP